MHKIKNSIKRKQNHEILFKGENPTTEMKVLEQDIFGLNTKQRIAR